MLVLSRKHGEQVRIGDDIVITILKTHGKTVRIGVEAPRALRVLRSELTVESHVSGTEGEASTRDEHTDERDSGSARLARRRDPSNAADDCSPRAARVDSVRAERWSMSSMASRVRSSSEKITKPVSS